MTLEIINQGDVALGYSIIDSRIMILYSISNMSF